MSRIFKLLVLSISISIVMFGCGEDGDDAVTKTGKFIDAPVQGLRYVTDSHSGITDQYGNYTYDEGDDVSFFLGKIPLGKVAAGEMINPMMLAGDTGDTVSDQAANIARLLQTLGTGDGTIVIPEKLKDLEVSDIDFTREADLNKILDEAKKVTSTTYALVSATDAKTEMAAAMKRFKDLENAVTYNKDENRFTLVDGAPLIISNMIIAYEGSFEAKGKKTTMSGVINYAEGIFKITTNGTEVDTSSTAGKALKTVFPLTLQGGANLNVTPQKAEIPAAGTGVDFKYTYTFETSYGDIVVTQEIK